MANGTKAEKQKDEKEKETLEKALGATLPEISVSAPPGMEISSNNEKGFAELGMQPRTYSHKKIVLNVYLQHQFNISNYYLFL